ncbi:MAG: PEP-CTERM sorting domain-containing protein [Leptolyngbyaceae cyanobacterium bins.59]|nr:PEP-CTERM sorting domain-containing protein [Leptolyngbyaceae cyanobacterium bins.59]
MSIKSTSKTSTQIIAGFILGLGVPFLTPERVQAASFTITPIATTGNEFTNLYPGIAINDQGVVSFTGVTPIDSRVFTGNGNSITSIFSSESLSPLVFQGSSSGFPPPPLRYFLGNDTAINNRGSILFTATQQSQFIQAGMPTFRGLFKIENGAVTQIGNSLQNFFFSFFRQSQNFTSFHLNDQGSVVAAVSGVTETPRSISQTQVLLNGSIIDSGASGSNFPPSSVGPPDINNQGRVFYGVSRSSFFPFPPLELNNVIEYNNGTRTPVVNQPVSAGFLAVNDQEQVIFSGNVNSQSGIFLVNNGVATRIFNGTGPVDINNAGTMVFQASEGIFMRSDHNLDRIIALGDSLFGSTVTRLAFPNAKGLNNQGQVAFYAEFADGSRGIFRADPGAAQVPEPALILGLVTLAGVGLRTRRKNRSSLRSNLPYLPSSGGTD